jgi:hypothetical protein
MPGAYRKKRRVVGPSKNEERVERNRREEALTRSSNSLGARFPNVRSLTVKLAFFGAQGQSFGEETRKFAPNDPCLFAVPCPGRCGVGSFDLAAKITAIIGAHEPQSQSSGVCQEPVAAGSSDTCQCRLDCAVEVAYTD